jgi:HD-GYP domain-containing protein (c-di-GMP phosphodiesterase class II)
MLAKDPPQKVERALKAMNSAVNHLRLYSAGHAIVQRSLEAAYRELGGLLAERDEATLLRVENELVWNDRPISAVGQRYARLMQDLEERGIESITFHRELGREEFQDFLQEIARGRKETISSRPKIKLGRLLLKTGRPAAEPADPRAADALGAFDALRERRLSDLQEIYAQIVRMKKINLQGVDDIIGAFIKAFACGVNPVGLLFEIRAADEYTYTHMVNVCILTMSQAESLGFTDGVLYRIGMAAILHDAGKLLIPQEIINKPGRLTEKERSVIETHSARGAGFILSQKKAPRLAVVGALEHHIRFDGTGYPAIAPGYRTNIVSQMITLADVFDAMRSRRPYQEPRPVKDILRVLQEGKGAAFNPVLVDNFLRLLKTASVDATAETAPPALTAAESG